MRQFIALMVLAVFTAVTTDAETIYVNGNKITGTKSLTTGGGTVSYDATTKVLTINNVSCERSGSNNNGIDCKDVTDLTINMSGTNSLKANNASAVVCGGKVTINIVSGVTSFISTAGSQNAIGMYGCNLSITGAGRLNLESTNGSAIQGREGVSYVSMGIAHCDITSSSYDFNNISRLSIGGSTSASVNRGLWSSTYIRLHAHSSSSVTHLQNVSSFSDGYKVSVKLPSIASVSDLSQTKYATQDVVITNEMVSTPDYTAVGEFVYESNPGNYAVLVGPDVTAKYTSTSLHIPGFVTLADKLLPVYIKDDAFMALPNLTYAKVCYGVRYIMNNAFYNCSKLQRLDLPGSLTNIGGDIVLGTSVGTIYWTTLDPSAATYATTAFRTYSSSKGTIYLPNQEAASKATAAALVNYFSPRASDDCYDVDMERSGTYDKYKFVLTKTATASSHGEMALVGVSSSQSSLIVNLSDGGNLSSYTYNVSYGDKRVYDLTAIAPYAFYANTKVTTAQLAERKIKTIGANAFSGCTGLKTVVVGQGVTSIGGNAFWGCNNINVLFWDAATMSAFSSSPFSSAASTLATVNIGSTVTNIPKNLLAACSAITTVNWEPASYPDFGSSTEAPFYSSRNKVAQVNFKNFVQYIPAYLCANFPALTQPSISGTVTGIGQYAFYNSGVTSVSMPSVTSIGKFAFANTPLTAVLLPSSLTSLGAAAFSGCASLATVTNNSAVTELKDNTFYGCTSLKAFVLNEGLTAIGNNTFYNCKALTSFELPVGVSSIGSTAFGNCTGLTGFSSYPACADITLGANVFYNATSGCTLHVRPSQLNAYKAANQWKDFFNKVGDLPDDDYNPYDVNNDGSVDVGDVNTVLGDILATGGKTAAYDVNGDGNVDVGDVNAILGEILNN